MLTEIFDVSTDYLLKDNVQTSESVSRGLDISTMQFSLEQAMKYVENKMNISQLVAKGVFLCVGSAMPLFALLAIVKTHKLNLTSNVAKAVGVIFILVMIFIGVSFLIRTNQHESDVVPIENEEFELAYGVHSVFKEKLQKYRSTYNLRLSVSIFIFIFIPLMIGSMLSDSSAVALMMLNVLLLMIATGIYILTPVSTKYEAYNNILKEGCLEARKVNALSARRNLRHFICLY